MANQMIGNQQKITQLDAGRSDSEQFLSFSLVKEQQALLPTHQLIEIVRISLSQITAIAGLAPYVMGIYNWRGDVIWAVDLASLLGYTPLYAQESTQEKFQDRYHIVFLRSQGNAIGLVVSNVGQMIRCDRAKIQTSSHAFTSPATKQACQGYWLSASGETFLVLDGNAIAQVIQT
ncbi:chemotaxis protein CheW [Pseudanabaena sp. UWO310]|uniref:chemotaxis protein CheW n=1 Tax=Pseudanabaena sp. UWO310 TaxID=2480795 RepID=UPI001158A08F|nr:CheW domain-containing protein [Pseudanabaena sp. UWO310]TYQ29906.1 CheW domain-containing protein [Pseudanabaena sp. UWO310]